MKNSSTQKFSKIVSIALTAMFSALICVATMFIKIPSPLGYQHAGDAIVYLSACILQNPYGMIASALGGAMSDLLSGYAIWVLPTLIIKAINALPFVLVKIYINKRSKNSNKLPIKKANDKIINLPNLLMLIPTSAVTIIGYTLATALIYDWKSALAELTILWVQPVISGVLFVVLGIALDLFKFTQLIDKTIKEA